MEIIIPNDNETYQEYIDRILASRENKRDETKYQERHHIIPKCLNGTDTTDNLIFLYSIEHFYCHKLLAIENPEKPSLIRAWVAMGFAFHNNQQIELPINEIELARDAMGVKVRCITINKVYPSITQASYEHNVDPSNIIRCCQGLTATCVGKEWEYVDEYLNQKYSQNKLDKQYLLNPQTKFKKRGKSVICCNTGIIYSSIKEAARLTGTNLKSLQACCSGVYATANNLQWAYADKLNDENYLCMLNAKKEETTSCHHKIICLETKKIYCQIKTASTEYNISPTNISKCCSGKQKTAGGCHWQYYEDYIKEHPEDIDKLIEAPVE